MTQFLPGVIPESPWMYSIDPKCVPGSVRFHHPLYLPISDRQREAVMDVANAILMINHSNNEEPIMPLPAHERSSIISSWCSS